MLYFYPYMNLLLISSLLNYFFKNVEAFLLPYTSSKCEVRFVLNTEKDHLKKSGYGISTISPGDFKLFDPEKEGKLQGTGVLMDRINSGPSYVVSTSTNYSFPEDALSGLEQPHAVTVRNAQHWLEYLDDDLPLHFAKSSYPVKATLLSRSRIISTEAPGDIQHIVLRLPKHMHYVEGQSLSVIPPGTNKVTGKPYSPRLYSISSTRYGDLLDGNTLSLCVRRAEYTNPITNIPDPSKKGVCSNYLCDATPGTLVNISGPVGKSMLLPSDLNTDIIMIATGTGIAPFRGFLHRLFVEDTLSRNMFGGTAWLILGVPVTGGLLYKEEIDYMIQHANPGQLKVDYAISREMKSPDGMSKCYVQHIIMKNANELFDRINNGASVYFCGLKMMMPPILKTLEMVARNQGIDWNKKVKDLISNNQWHVEVY